jgi:hypothetical protein
MDHRRLLFALVCLAVLGGLAGCSAAGSIDMRAVNDSELAEAASRSFDREPDRPGGNTPPEIVLNETITNGSSTYTGLAPPIEQGLPFEVADRYYNLTYSVVNTSSASRVSIRIDYNATEPNGTAIEFSELPAVDKEALRTLLPPRDVPPSEGYELGVNAVYTDAELNRSVLTPDTPYDVVIFDGERYPILVEEPESVTVNTYRYEAREIASNASVYAAQLRSQYVFRLTDLSEAEQSVVTEAVESGGYYAESTDDSGFESLLERFQARDAITSDRASGLWLVRYEGEVYLVDLHYGGFLGE